MSRMTTFAARLPMRGLGVAALVVALGLGGCAPGAVSPLAWDDRLDLGVPSTMIETVEGVEYYPACGNEVLEWQGKTYYPYRPVREPELLTVLETTSLALAKVDSRPSVTDVGWARLSIPVGTVAAPGPGEDVGTLTVFEGGHAYWESNSGQLHTWLTTTELTYTWVC